MADGALAEEVADDSYSHHMQVYSDASPAVMETWRTQTPQTDEYTDSYGTFRSIFIPYTAPNGNRYVFGADMATTDVAAMMQQARFSELGLLLFFLLLGVTLSWLFASVIVGRIPRHYRVRFRRSPTPGISPCGSKPVLRMKWV